MYERWIVAACTISLVIGMGALRAAAQMLDPTAPPPVAVPEPAGDAPDADPGIRDAIVKIHTTHRAPNPFMPWTRGQQSSSVASGMVIEGQRILTNAHAVAFGSQIYIQPNRSADRYEAEVEAISIDLDLAVLKVIEKPKDFFKDRAALTINTAIPDPRDKVVAYGYPVGGEEQSVTEGIISRIEMTRGTDSYLLRLQVDAPINPGNSGGPIVVDGKVVGVVYEAMEGENIGYAIAALEVERFLKDAADGKIEGKPHITFGAQTVENDALREYLELPDEVTGLMVANLVGDAKDHVLKPWDVITHIGEHDIDNTGMVDLNGKLRVSFHFYLDKMADKHDNKIPLTVRRKGETINVDLPAIYQSTNLVVDLGTERPPYFIYGPLTFSVVNSSATREWYGRYFGLLALMESPIVKRLREEQAVPGEELVFVCSRAFPHRTTKGYDSPTWRVVKTVNGTEIKHLKQLVEYLRDSDDEYLIFEFHESAAEKLVFRRRDLERATEQVLTDNGIRHQASPELRKVWATGDDE